MFRLLVLILCLYAGAAHAGFYSVTNTNDSGNGSLRQGILNANASSASPSSPYVISIVIPGAAGSTATITLASQLPIVSKPVLILGPANRTVVVQPPAAQRGAYNGINFAVDAAGSSVYFLTVQGFAHGIYVSTNDFTLAGSTLRDNRLAGLAAVNAVGLLVGGNGTGERNVFIENGWEASNTQPRAGAWIHCTQRDGAGECAIDLDTTIGGNFFGLARDGITEAGNLHYGLLLESVRGVHVGTESASNVFGYNGNSGILAREHSRSVYLDNTFIGYNGVPVAPGSVCDENFWANYCDGITLLDSSEFAFHGVVSGGNARHGIGVHGGIGLHTFRSVSIGIGTDGSDEPVANGMDGIHLDGGNDSSIGLEDSAASANRIANNGGAGVRIVSGQRNAIHPNAIFDNLDAGIVVAAGANGNQPAPVITSSSPPSGTVGGSGVGLVYLFADGADEGEFYLGSAPITGVTFSANIDLGAYAGLSLTAVAVRGNNASRFSAPFPIGSATTHSLHVSVTGQGRVVSDPAGIDCTLDCQAPFTAGTSVDLTATATPGWRFVGWQSDCVHAGANPVCAIAIDAERTARAVFVADADRIFASGFDPD